MNDKRNADTAGEELALRLWSSNESALEELLRDLSPSIERAIQGRFPGLSHEDVEDVVIVAFRKFWDWRQNFDPAKASARTVIYKVAFRVALERVACRRRWEKACRQEVEMSDEVAESLAAYDKEMADEAQSAEPDKRLAKAVAEVVQSVWSPQERAVWEAFANAGEGMVSAAELGIELGQKFSNGVPIPASTIRITKYRAKEKFVRELKRRGFDLKQLGFTDE